MSRANKALVLMAVALMGIWGCTQGPANGAAGSERIKALEEKCVKLQDDNRAAVSAREQVKKKLAAVEAERDRIAQDLEQQRLAARERDELRQQLAVRTCERDSIQAQFEGFRSSIRNLLGQAEAATAATVAPTASSSTESSSPGKS